MLNSMHVLTKAWNAFIPIPSSLGSEWFFPEPERICHFSCSSCREPSGSRTTIVWWSFSSDCCWVVVSVSLHVSLQLCHKHWDRSQTNRSSQEVYSMAYPLMKSFGSLSKAGREKKMELSSSRTMVLKLFQTRCFLCTEAKPADFPYETNARNIDFC